MTKVTLRNEAKQVVYSREIEKGDIRFGRTWVNIPQDLPPGEYSVHIEYESVEIDNGVIHIAERRAT